MLTVLSIPVSEASRRKRPTCRLPGEPAASGEHGADDRGRWLTVAGDVAEGFSQVERALALLSARFAKAIWALGNLELWTMPNDEAQLRGEAGCQKLVDVYRAPGVATRMHIRRGRQQPGRWSSRQPRLPPIAKRSERRRPETTPPRRRPGTGNSYQAQVPSSVGDRLVKWLRYPHSGASQE